MKIKLKYNVYVKPDPRTGEYPEHIAKRLVKAGLATLETADQQVIETRTTEDADKWISDLL